uniref:histone acetyltransferase n=1 Tax=Phallusia mammillata TaxID=59560 RepID=A0A6F9DEU9_9ASCI|nr:histone acetyltransferase KAT6A [Phallusia mammillata]
MVRSGSTSSIGPKSPTSTCAMDKDSPEKDVLSTAIIETIRRIRSQKQRPSLERISKWVMNRTAARNCSLEDVTNRLEDLSSCGKILKVFNQGEYSYRDPETMTPRASGRASKAWKDGKQRQTPTSTATVHKSPLHSPTSPKIASPELTLIPRNPLMRHKTLQVLDYIKLVQVSLEGLSQPEGATIKDMDRYLETTYYIEGISAIDFSRHLRLACKRLVNAGRLIKDGLIFRLAPNALPMSQELPKVSNPVIKDEENTNETSSPPMRVCDYCRGTAQCNKEGVIEPLLSCIDCGNSGHPTCMKLSSELAAKVRNLQWQCIECKSCKVCGSKGNADNLLFCDSCDRGFHMECCTPPLSKMPKGSFVCELCRSEASGKKKPNKLGLESGKLSSRGPGRPSNAQRRLLNSYSTTNGQSHAPLNSPTDTDEKPHEILSESGQHLLQIPFNKKPKGLIDGMTRFFTPSMGGRKTLTSQARTTQLMIMQRTNDSSTADDHSSKEDDPSTGKDSTDKSCKANITELDENMFFRAREESLHRTGVVEGEPPDPSTVRCPESIEFGKYSIETWYSSPYPQEYARLKKLYMCEFCLKYMKSHAILQRHAKKCQWFHPPANEIYRSGHLSVFEVDGNVSKIYCQNLCLLAKLFLDHKTLYYDVEPFSFYCLTRNDSKGCHLVGYFSKEKHCQQKYNVSCIMTMPQYQRQGYGRFLIDFSYLLSRKEGQAGSPEKPLSDLGQVSYNAYWRSAMLEYLSKKSNEKHLSLRDISKSTGICPHDIASTLQKLGMIKVKAVDDQSGPVQFRFNLSRKRHLVAEYMHKRELMSKDPTRPPKPTVDPDCLRWTPLLASTSFLTDESGIRSPSTTPEKRLPLSPTSRLNFSPPSKHQQTAEDHQVLNTEQQQNGSSDIENIETAAASPQEPRQASPREAPASPDPPNRNDVTVACMTSPSNADIAKGFIPPMLGQKKRGRPRKKPLTESTEEPGSFLMENGSAGLLRSPQGRKKRRRKVKGYPWGKVVKKRKKKSNDNSSDKLDTSDTDMPTRGNGWRLGGPHFSSDSEDEASKENKSKTNPDVETTADAQCSSDVTDQPRDVADPEDVMKAGDDRRSSTTHLSSKFQLSRHASKRRRRKSKGYQWGAIKRKIKKPLANALRRVAMGAVAKRNGPGRPPKKVIPPAIAPLLVENSHEEAASPAKKPLQTTIHQFFQRRNTACTNNNNINVDSAKSAQNGSVGNLYSALNDSNHVVVASVTLSPKKRLPTHGSGELKRKVKKSPFTPSESEPKQRRRSAIAGDNFVASCLLSSRAHKKSSMLGGSGEKKRPRGRPRSSLPPELPLSPKDENSPSEAEQSDTNASFLGQGPHIQNSESMRSSLTPGEGTVAFAKLWIPTLGSGASNVSQSSTNPFKLDNTFSNMSFKAASSYSYHRSSKRFDLQSPSLTTYREMNRPDYDEDNEMSSSSSSDAESTSCSSAESSEENSSDEEPTDARDAEDGFDRQWREKSRKMLKRRNQDAAKQLENSNRNSTAEELIGADVGASDYTEVTRKVDGVKRGRGRPRKYPPKEENTPKVKNKKKTKKVQEKRLEKESREEEKKSPGLKLTVHRTSGVYHTSHSVDNDQADTPLVAEDPMDDEATNQGDDFTPIDPSTPDSRVFKTPSPPTVEEKLEKERLSCSESESDTSSSESDSAMPKIEDDTTLCHGDPTLPTWGNRCPNSSCTSTGDAWTHQGVKSPGMNPSPASMSPQVLDDSSMGTVFASVADVRPSSSLSNAIERKDVPPETMEYSEDLKQEDSDCNAKSPETEEVYTNVVETSRLSSTSEEEKEINAAVASITQLDAGSPMIHETYQVAQNQYTMSPANPPQAEQEPPNRTQSQHPSPPEPQGELSSTPVKTLSQNSPERNELDRTLVAEDVQQTNDAALCVSDVAQRHDDSANENMFANNAPQNNFAQNTSNVQPQTCPIQAPAQYHEPKPQPNQRKFPSACGVDSGSYENPSMGDMQSSFVGGQVQEMAMTDQCQFGGQNYHDRGEYTEPIPQQRNSFQQEISGNFASEIYQPTQQQQQQQQHYGANNTYTDQRMFNTFNMTGDNNNATPTRRDVIDDVAQPNMTSPKGGFQVQAANSQTSVAGSMAAPCQPVNPIPTQVAHAHGFQAAPNGPGGSGSTSGYDTLSNNSCSPYTSPESVNQGTCEHTISTTASAQHMEGTYTPAQASLTGGVSMSVAVQPHHSAPPGVMYSAPSNDSGHGSEYLASPASHGMPSCQGTPPKPSMQPQQTMLSPEPYQQPRQQLNSAGSYTNLPSPNLNQNQQKRSSCAVANDKSIHPPQSIQLMPCMVQQQQRSPSIIKTPTTPQCAFPHTDDAFQDSRQLAPPSTAAEHSPSPTQHNPNSLVKLQQLTQDISGGVTSGVATYTTRTTPTQHQKPTDAFTQPQIALRRPRYTSSGHPERPASVQPQVVTPLESCPPPSTPPASISEAPHYAPGGVTMAPNYNYNHRAWEGRPATVARQHSMNAYPTTYEQPWHGGFGNYPASYGPNSGPCQFDPQYGLNPAAMPQTHKFVHGNSGTYHHNPMMQPGRQGGYSGPREADPYPHPGTYGSIGVRGAFPPHEVRPNLHGTYPGPAYGSYPTQGQGYYPTNSFSYR